MEIAALATPAEAHARIAFALAEVRKYLIPDNNDNIRQEQMREMELSMADDPAIAEDRRPSARGGILRPSSRPAPPRSSRGPSRIGKLVFSSVSRYYDYIFFIPWLHGCGNIRTEFAFSLILCVVSLPRLLDTKNTKVFVWCTAQRPTNFLQLMILKSRNNLRRMLDKIKIFSTSPTKLQSKFCIDLLQRLFYLHPLHVDQ